MQFDIWWKSHFTSVIFLFKIQLQYNHGKIPEKYQLMDILQNTWPPLLKFARLSMIKYEKLSLTRSSLRRHKVFNITWYPRRRRQWHPTPVLLPRKSHGPRSLVGYSPRGRKELDTTEQLHLAIGIIKKVLDLMDSARYHHSVWHRASWIF